MKHRVKEGDREGQEGTTKVAYGCDMSEKILCLGNELMEGDLERSRGKTSFKLGGKRRR